jgi:hypothetical protein
MTRKSKWTIVAGLLLASGCAHNKTIDMGPEHDRPFPLGQVTDAFWDTQATNAEAGDFVFYDHEFVGETAALAPGAKRHLEQVALRLEHVPFPVVIESTTHNAAPQLDQARRRTVVEQLARMGLPNLGDRVIVAPAFSRGVTGIEAEGMYYGIFGGGGLGGATYR